MTEPTKDRLLIVAGSWPSCVRYANEHHIPADEFTYVTKPEQVTRGSMFVLTGMYTYTRYWRDIEIALLKMDCRRKADR